MIRSLRWRGRESTAPLPVRIVVRTDTDWRRMDRERFEAQDDPTRPLKWIRFATDVGVLDHWERAFDQSFFEYRHRLQRLGLETFHAASGVEVTRGLDGAESWLTSGDDEILVPTDDDDFLRSDIGDVASLFDDGTNVVLWPTAACGFASYGRRRVVQRWPLPVLGPNNFAIRKSYLVREFGPKWTKIMLADHHAAHRRVAEKLGMKPPASKRWDEAMLRHASVRHIRRCMSIYNVHPGSIYYLLRIVQEGQGWKTLRALDLERPARIPPYARPFRPFVRRLEAESRALRTGCAA